MRMISSQRNEAHIGVILYFLVKHHEMLEPLQDIEIASRLVGFDVDSDDSLDDMYKKLSCDIDSKDYRVIQKYLLTTQSPKYMDWKLEIEEVFLLDRPGEFDKFAPPRDKLGNIMLLWHGYRLTNFVGILSQGLRIAPPEAPTTGYMFGKRVYFADLVSNSAQYCFRDKKNPVRLMLLSEVALGQVHELKRPQDCLELLENILNNISNQLICSALETFNMLITGGPQTEIAMDTNSSSMTNKTGLAQDSTTGFILEMGCRPSIIDRS